MARIFGGTYTYPNATACPTPQYGLTEDKTGGNWHVTGMVGTYSGMGLWDNCLIGTTGTSYASPCTIDASAYSGIQFTISGDAGPPPADAGTGSVSFQVNTSSRLAPATDAAGNPTNCGACTLGASCTIPTVLVPVTSTPTTVTVTWADLGIAATDAQNITLIQWNFTNPANIDTATGISTTPYSLNITIDDLQFVP